MSERKAAYLDGGESGEAGDLAEYVAVCPLTPRLAGQIISLADLRWDGEGWWETTDEAMRALGWWDDAETELAFMARFVTDQGQHVYEGDARFLMPFCEQYHVGEDLAFTEDEWGRLPGWTSVRGAGREDFNAHLGAAVDQFTQLLGPPELDVLVDAPDVPGGRRYAGWRCAGNALVVGQGPEPLSFFSGEEARVCIGPLGVDEGFPPAAELGAFLQF